MPQSLKCILYWKSVWFFWKRTHRNNLPQCRRLHFNDMWNCQPKLHTSNYFIYFVLFNSICCLHPKEELRPTVSMWQWVTFQESDSARQSWFYQWSGIIVSTLKMRILDVPRSYITYFSGINKECTKWDISCISKIPGVTDTLSKRPLENKEYHSFVLELGEQRLGVAGWVSLRFYGWLMHSTRSLLCIPSFHLRRL